MNPEDIDLGNSSSLAGYKTGMQAMLSDVVDQKSHNIPKRRTNELPTSVGMKVVSSVTKKSRGLSVINDVMGYNDRNQPSDLSMNSRIGKSQNLSRTFVKTPKQFSIDRRVMKDNPSRENVTDIGKYLHNLDQRLSIPKFTKDSELTENQKLFKIGNGIRNEYNQLRRSKLRSGSVSPDSRD